MSDWFSRQFGVAEGSYQDVMTNFAYDYDSGVLTCRPNQRKWAAGLFSTPSLGELRHRNQDALTNCQGKNQLRVSMIQDDVQRLHGLPELRHATFQAASQFNCLEMISPDAVPEDGIEGYARDRTQGPACVVSTGPGILMRNYFAKGFSTSGGVGQHRNDQINTLKDLARFLGDETSAGGNAGGPRGKYFTVRSGYTMATSDQLRSIPRDMIEGEARDEAKSRVRIGVQTDTQVTAAGGFGTKLVGNATNVDKDSQSKEEDETPHLVTHALCSAVALNYNPGACAEEWAPLASLILEAAYEATLYVALEASRRHSDSPGAKVVLLTLVGGGVFGNSREWINEAIRQACIKFRHCDLDVRIVYYGQKRQTSSNFFQKLLQTETDFVNKLNMELKKE